MTADLESRIAALSPEQRALLESRIAGLAAPRGASANGRILPRDPDRPTPLSFAQQREWALERFRPANNISGAIRLEGDVDLDLISRVLTEITTRHEVLRSTVEMAEGSRMPVQVVHPVSPVPVPVVDLSHLDPEPQTREVRLRFDAEVTRPFPPDQAQRIRVTMLRLAPHTYVALLSIHHSSADGWSLSIVIRETAALYQAFREGKGASLPLPPIQYGDFAVWQRERLGEEWMAAEVEYWRGVLADMPPRLALPTDRPHPVRRTFAGDQHKSALSREDTAALQKFAEGEGASISMVMLAACSVMLYRYTDQDDLVFGSAITGRVRTETEQLIGCFANALPLRMRVSRNETLLEVLHRARGVASAAFDHQDIPFDRLIEELAPKETSQTPLVQMMINVLTTPGDLLRQSGQAMRLPGLTITPEPTDIGPLPIDLILLVEARPDMVHFQWHYSSELFDAQTVVRLAAELDHIIYQLVSRPDTRVADVDLLGTAAAAPGADRAQAALEAEASVGVVELIQRQAARAPDAPAVIYDGAATTFEELNREANRLARHLRTLGVAAETTVGILLDRSPQLAVAMLGVLKAGGAYVPIDAQYPAERISLMLSDARAPVLITTEDLAALAEGAGPAQTVLMGGQDWQQADGGDLPGTPSPTWPAYVVYTSGSTGQPKGVVTEHRSLVTFAREVAGRLQLGAGDRFLQFASPSFDVLAEELFPVWLAGGAVVIPPPRMTGAGLDLMDLAEREHLSVLELPAAYWHEWVRELDRTGRALPSSLRLVIVGAERVLPERLAMWQKLGVPLMHVYGITETTVSSTFFRLPQKAQAADLQHLPIGTALPSVDLQILDSGLRPVPVGGVGELYIGGISVARGYLRHPALTAERFIADPDPAHPGQRVYRTGDLVRQRADGNLEFLSRADAQIKIRGFRVEPAEIESAMCRHPQVAQAVVTMHEPAPGDRRLAAYMVPQPRTRPNTTDLRRFLAREIPDYLVPAAFVRLEALPLTANGKVDFDRLPEPSSERPELVEEFVQPESPLERQLADIVAAVLGVTVVGANDNFFELGGDSILAIQVAARAQETGIGLAPLDIFEHPTVTLLAQAVTDPERTTQAADDAQAIDEAQARTAGTRPTPGDFPLAAVNQDQLDVLLSRLGPDQKA
jgi:amino acid adenylation domain-containing protein